MRPQRDDGGAAAISAFFGRAFRFPDRATPGDRITNCRRLGLSSDIPGGRPDSFPKHDAKIPFEENKLRSKRPVGETAMR